MPESPANDPPAPPGLSPGEADYHRLFDLALDLLCIAGLDGYFKRVNPSWTRVLGWSEAELLAQPVVDFMHPDDRERTLRARRGLAHGMPVRDLENRYRCKDGSYRWLSWQSVVEPEHALVFAVAHDITARRQLDQERMVISKLESTGIFAGGIAHDFNNLLASLLLNLDALGVAGTLTPAQDQYLRQARQTIHAASALTKQLITFAHGGAPIRRTCDLKNLLQRSLELSLTGSAVHRRCEVAPDLWPADVDEIQIGQVFRSLMLNAREATPAGGHVDVYADNTVLTTGVAPDLAPGDYLRIRIVDDGAGITADVLPKIFDPYFSTKQRGTQKGMGLGLAICRTLIQKNGGGIGIASIPGHGTTVTCHLPASRRLGNPPAPVTPPGAVPPPPASKRAPQKRSVVRTGPPGRSGKSSMPTAHPVIRRSPTQRSSPTSFLTGARGQQHWRMMVLPPPPQGRSPWQPTVFAALVLCLAGPLPARTDPDLLILDTCESLKTAFRAFHGDTFPETKWTCDEGVLRSIKGQRVDLVTREAFEDFDLELEWKVTWAANSGIMYGVTEAASDTFWSGPEMQINDDPHHSDGLQPKTSAGGLYDLIAPSRRDLLKPTGDYNQVRILSRRGHIEHWLNGVKVVDYEWDSPELRALIQSTKSAAAPLFMKARRGHLALQSEGDEASFRHIRIRRLDSAGASPRAPAPAFAHP